MLSVAPTEGRHRAAPTPRCGNFGRLATISCKAVKAEAMPPLPLPRAMFSQPVRGSNSPLKAA